MSEPCGFFGGGGCDNNGSEGIWTIIIIIIVICFLFNGNAFGNNGCGCGNNNNCRKPCF